MKAKFPIIKHAGMWVGLATCLMIVSAVLFYLNFRPSIQFTGGIQIKTSQAVAQTAVEDILAVSWVSQVAIHTETINREQYSTILTQVTTKEDTEVNQISQDIQKVLVEKSHISDKTKIAESSIIGASIGEYLTKSARTTIIVWLILMALYMVFAFAGVRQYIQPQVLAAITIFTMFFDVLIPMGIYAIKMATDLTAQVDLIFVIALLTTMGYSINDTVIVFDRIRENLINAGGKIKDIGQIFEDSIWQTMTRSLGTSLATFVVVVAMYVFGTGDLGRFAFSMGMGVLSGTFSSIFLAAPLAYLIIKHTKSKK